MGVIRSPFDIPELNTKPPMDTSPRVSDDIQQTLATLVGYDGVTRHLVRCTPRGLLQVVNPRIIGFLNISRTNGNYAYQGSNIPCSEIIVRADKDNSSLVWVNVFAVAGEDIGWPLSANEYITMTITNMQQLHLLIVGDAEKVVILYTQ